MKLHIVTGFLGSGKTTAIYKAATLLIKQNIPVAVITNDQGSRLVDGDLFTALGIPGRQVKGGCFCCNYNELDKNIHSLTHTEGSSLVFAEAVGSCTDIIATVLKPLQEFHPEIGLTISTFTDIRLLKMMLDGNHSFDESVAYIYHKQLEEAEIVIVNKTDLVNDEIINDIAKQLSARYSGKLLLFQNSLSEPDILQWLALLDNYRRNSLPDSLVVDYDIYATGEAKMAWYDQQLELYTEYNDAGQIAEQLINSIYTEIVQLQVPIGHVKFLVDSTTKISFTSKDEEPVKLQLQPASTSAILVNIRVQETPDRIHELIGKILIRFRQKCKVNSTEAEVFSPGYPTPVYRM